MSGRDIGAWSQTVSVTRTVEASGGGSTSGALLFSPPPVDTLTQAPLDSRDARIRRGSNTGVILCRRIPDGRRMMAGNAVSALATADP